MAKPDDPEQSKRFIEMAQEADTSPEDFDRAFRKVAAAKRQSTTKTQLARKKR
jgi:hypothetical protein